MTSKERVQTTLVNHEADRVPINYQSNPGVDARLKQHYGLDPNDGEGLRPQPMWVFGAPNPRPGCSTRSIVRGCSALTGE